MQREGEDSSHPHRAFASLAPFYVLFETGSRSLSTIVQGRFKLVVLLIGISVDVE